MAELCGNLAAGKPSTLDGTGEQTRDYVYVDDVARANVLALENDPPPGPYNIGTGIETSVNRLYELLQGISGKDLPSRNGPGKPGEQFRSCVDPSHAGRVFGWRPEVSLADGLRDTPLFRSTVRTKGGNAHAYLPVWSTVSGPTACWRGDP